MILISTDQLNKRSTVPDVDADRTSSLISWFSSIQSLLPVGDAGSETRLAAVSGDASFRRYFRMNSGEHSYILMDAPPAMESCQDFIAIAEVLRQYGVRTPQIYAMDLGQGFLCLEDFGSTLYWQKLDEAAQRASATISVTPGADELYQAALQQLLLIQGSPVDGDYSLPAYDDTLLLAEMHLFRDWLCERLLFIPLGSEEKNMFERLFAGLIEVAHRQPQVFVHRDYHSRNLMYCEGQPPGILDFQDAVCGPLCYDLVSLLKDCYIAWPRPQVEAWALAYLQQARAANLVQDYADQDFLEDFDLMGVQRHLKASGIFARLWLRDGKSAYLKDIPRTLAYITALAGKYEHVPGFTEFQDWCHRVLEPALATGLEHQAEQSQ